MISEENTITLSSRTYNKPIINAAIRSCVGTGHRENQDACCIEGRRFCVADGHGPFGQIAAETVCATVRTSPETESYEDMFIRAEEAVRAIDKFHKILSGTTATVLTIELDGSCHVGAVGDSEARYYDSDNDDGVSLTLDHSASNINEFHRIRVLPNAASFVFGGGGAMRRPVFVKCLADIAACMEPKMVSSNPPDEWIPNPQEGFKYCNVRLEWSSYVSANGNNLAVTRAIGDFDLKKYGLIATPTIVTAVAPTTGTIRAIVLASDGLWDCMHYSEIRNIVRNPECIGQAELAADRLLIAAKAYSIERFESRDDISLIIVYVKM